MELSRDNAYALLTEFTKSDSLIKHALAVEAAMREYARRFGEDEKKWGIVGLIHDFDYEQFPTPDQHPATGGRILEERGYPADVVYAVRSHGDHLGLPRLSLLDKTLSAVDELTGFIAACALVRPDRSIASLEVSSVKKKMKDKAFARAVKREDIVQGAEVLGISLDDHIANVIRAMQGIASELGLA